MIEYVSSWFTPTVLFCVINLVIGTILLSSSLKPQKKQHQLGDDNSVPQLARVPSLIQRVRSFNYSFRQEHDPFSYAQNTPSLSRAPSPLERFSAVNFSFSRSDHPGDFPANTHHADLPENETQITRAPSLLERVMSFSRSRQPDPFPSNSSFSRSDNPGDFPANTHHADPPEDETHITRSPSLLQRVKSINLSFSRSRQPDPFPSTTHFTELQTQKVEVEEEERDSGAVMSHARRTKSATCAEIPAKKKKMGKSASEKMEAEETQEEVDRRRPATVREKKTAYEEDDEAVDEKADDFINRFKQQLKLQRLDSLLRYKETLHRRMGN
ncbi:pathogen-associated molecular patterns-induced protein A70-like [Ipomoea triloba]|uniref:pathogen-associated molecular patterns-induced protein A70-like n=1 Tax=Ipomoea triloba TaxID=35885 RepID=UPI00125E4D81|nr:pathogen-associated molecular patterns-induced protein A70-like [Ipomoea triloba]